MKGLVANLNRNPKRDHPKPNLNNFSEDHGVNSSLEEIHLVGNSSKNKSYDQGSASHKLAFNSGIAKKRIFGSGLGSSKVSDEG